MPRAKLRRPAVCAGIDLPIIPARAASISFIVVSPCLQRSIEGDATVAVMREMTLKYVEDWLKIDYPWLFRSIAGKLSSIRFEGRESVV